MEKREVVNGSTKCEQNDVDRLRLASIHLADAQIERTLAISSAHKSGMSVRRIAEVSNLSPSRVHQVLNSAEAAEIPAWLTRVDTGRNLESAAVSAGSIAGICGLVVEEVKVLRRCIDWLDQIERGESVVVNLRLETDPETEYVGFDRKRITRILRRIASDLERLAKGQQVSSEGQDDPVTRHRGRLAEPEEQPKKLSMRGARNALRAELNLPSV